MKVSKIINTMEVRSFAINFTERSMYALTSDYILYFLNDKEWKSYGVSIYNSGEYNEIRLLGRNASKYFEPDSKTYEIVQELSTLFPIDSNFSISSFTGYIRNFRVWSDVLSVDELVSYDSVNADPSHFPYLIFYIPFNDSQDDNDIQSYSLYNTPLPTFIQTMPNTTRSSGMMAPLNYLTNWTQLSNTYYHITQNTISFDVNSSKSHTLGMWVYPKDIIRQDLIVVVGGSWNFRFTNRKSIYFFIDTTTPIEGILSVGSWWYIAFQLAPLTAASYSFTFTKVYKPNSGELPNNFTNCIRCIYTIK
jgi:hypothetical protein